VSRTEANGILSLIMASSSSSSTAAPVSVFGSTGAAGSYTTTTLSLLPKDIVETILTKYCDGYTLNQFWLASVGSKSPWNSQNHSKTVAKVCTRILWDAIFHRKNLIEKNRELLHKDHVDDLLLDRVLCEFDMQREGAKKNLEDSSVSLSNEYRLFSDACFAMDYAERMPLNIVWCGTLNVRDPSVSRLLHQSAGLLEQGIKVMVVMDPIVWSLRHVRAWNPSFKSDVTASSSTSDEPTEIILQHYNFLPMSPQGRVIGVTKADRLALRRISERMKRDNLVGTLPASYHRGGSNGDGFSTFICRMISFAQAKERAGIGPRQAAEQFGDQMARALTRIPLKVINEENGSSIQLPFSSEDLELCGNAEYESLYCNWEYRSRNDQGRAQDSLAQERLLFRDCYRSYHKVRASESLW
jgi:hypothetical protein